MTEPKKTPTKRAQPAAKKATTRKASQPRKAAQPRKAPTGTGTPAAERTENAPRDTSSTPRAAAAASRFGAPFSTGNRLQPARANFEVR